MGLARIGKEFPVRASDGATIFYRFGCDVKIAQK
jgi:hypothetical protein